MHPCPKCGKPTEGVYFENGVKSELCEDCLVETVEQEDMDTDVRRNETG